MKEHKDKLKQLQIRTKVFIAEHLFNKVKEIGKESKERM